MYYIYRITNKINGKTYIGKPAWNKGKPMSDEQKKKISETLKEKYQKKLLK